MNVRFGFSLVIALSMFSLTSCAKKGDSRIDSSLAADIDKIKAVDNHAHPVRVTAPGERDNEYDALPVENLEPSSDPLRMRPANPDWTRARHALFPSSKLSTMRERGDNYPSWVLDQIGIETMLANRVAMGRGLAPSHFRWVAFADALLFPLNNASLAQQNSDRKAFFALEEKLLARYVKESGLQALPPTLGEYLQGVVTPTLERHRRDGALGEKFEAAYLRTLEFKPADRNTAESAYEASRSGSVPPDAEYKQLQDFLFRYIAGECGRLDMAVHLHTAAGAGSYFQVGGANPLLMEPILNDPALRKTRFVLVHGGWPFTREMAALLTKPNVWTDFSSQSLLLSSAELAVTVRQWLELVPEKVLFGTDAYPNSDAASWEESAWVANRAGRDALAIALTGMMRDGEISPERARELARMVLRENARKLYKF